MAQLRLAPVCFWDFWRHNPYLTAVGQYNLYLLYSMRKYVGNSPAFLAKTEEKLQEGTGSQHKLLWITPMSTTSTNTG